jgi:hypothetical protein
MSCLAIYAIYRKMARFILWANNGATANVALAPLPSYWFALSRRESFGTIFSSHHFSKIGPLHQSQSGRVELSILAVFGVGFLHTTQRPSTINGERAVEISGFIGSPSVERWANLRAEHQRLFVVLCEHPRGDAQIQKEYHSYPTVPRIVALRLLQPICLSEKVLVSSRRGLPKAQQAAAASLAGW